MGRSEAETLVRSVTNGLGFLELSELRVSFLEFLNVGGRIGFGSSFGGRDGSEQSELHTAFVAKFLAGFFLEFQQSSTHKFFIPF
jgi:hypothetical protein